MKQGIRQSIIAARQKLAEAERARLAQEITAHLLDLPIYRQAANVLGYMSFGAEFNTLAWLQQALQDGKAIWLPRVNRESRQLDLYRVQDLARDVAPGMWQIPEPLEARCEILVDLSVIDFVLLPGVAFGRGGERLGYGGGFYDKLLERMLMKTSPALVAAAFSMQLVEGIPMEPLDKQIEWLVTELESVDCRRN